MVGVVGIMVGVVIGDHIVIKHGFCLVPLELAIEWDPLIRLYTLVKQFVIVLRVVFSSTTVLIRRVVVDRLLMIVG